MLPRQVASIDVAEIHLRAQITQLHLYPLEKSFLYNILSNLHRNLLYLPHDLEPQ